MNTQLPRAITRDETQHGKLYYTRKQLIDYGQRCVKDAAKKEKIEKPNYSEAINEILHGMGIKK